MYYLGTVFYLTGHFVNILKCVKWNDEKGFSQKCSDFLKENDQACISFDYYNLYNETLISKFQKNNFISLEFPKFCKK